MLNPNGRMSGERNSDRSENGFEKLTKLEWNPPDKASEKASDASIDATRSARTESLDALRSKVMEHALPQSQQDEEKAARAPRPKREASHNPNSEEVIRETGQKAGHEEIIRNGENAKRSANSAFARMRRNAERGDVDAIVDGVERAQGSIDDLVGVGESVSVFELGEGSLGKIEVIERVVSGEDFEELISSVNAPVKANYDAFSDKVKAQLGTTKDTLRKEAQSGYITTGYDVLINGKKTTRSFEKDAEDIAKSLLAKKSPSYLKKTPPEVLAQEDDDRRLRSDGAKTLEAFRLACRDKKIQPSKKEQKILDHITALENNCNLLDDTNEARSACADLRSDLRAEASTDFSKATKRLEKIEKKLAKQERKLMRKMRGIGLDDLQRRVEDAEK